MPVSIALADYGVGNLHSIRKALENCGARVAVVEDMGALLEAECIVFPGVGAFSKTMEKLLPIREDIVSRLADGVPCLGICIGMQIMFDRSEEGSSPGLGFLEGDVVRLKAKKIPHMGWNTVETADGLFEGVESKHFYFAHSYCGDPAEDIVIGRTDYYSEFASLVKKGNTYGTQFHPEKSSFSGMKFLANFVAFAEECL